jgi:hypothetical protein
MQILSGDYKIRTYEDLQRHIHYALRDQNPEWVNPNGASPLCDLYEERFALVLAMISRAESNLSGPKMSAL